MNFADYVEGIAEEKIIVTMNRTAKGVFNWENGEIGNAILNRLKGSFELIAGDCYAVRAGFAGGGFGVSTGNPLVSDVKLLSAH